MYRQGLHEPGVRALAIWQVGGFSTETYRTGADPLRIARAGGWKDGSATLLGYIDDVDRRQANPSGGRRTAGERLVAEPGAKV